jgi:hypothetical protein
MVFKVYCLPGFRQYKVSNSSFSSGDYVANGQQPGRDVARRVFSHGITTSSLSPVVAPVIISVYVLRGDAARDVSTCGMVVAGIVFARYNICRNFDAGIVFAECNTA